jgi:hypothetical protein
MLILSKMDLPRFSIMLAEATVWYRRFSGDLVKSTLPGGDIGKRSQRPRSPNESLSSTNLGSLSRIEVQRPKPCQRISFGHTTSSGLFGSHATTVAFRDLGNCRPVAIPSHSDCGLSLPRSNSHYELKRRIRIADAWPCGVIFTLMN